MKRLVFGCLPWLWVGCAHFDPQPLEPARTAAALESRSLNDPALQSFVRTNLPPSQAGVEWPLKHWNLESLTLVGLYYQPSLDLARAQWGVARGSIRTAAARPNPSLNVLPGYNFTPLETASGALASPWFPAVNLDWPIETAGKRGYRQARADYTAESARLALAQTAWQIRSAVRAALVDVAWTARRVDVLAEQVELTRRVAEAAQRRLDAGAVSVLENSQRRVAADLARLDLAEAQRQSALARAKLAETLSLPAAALEAVPLDFELGLRPEDATDQDPGALRDLALLGRADVLSGVADYAASQAALQLEIARQYPDVHLNTGYQYDQGDHKWSFGFTVELPILNQNQGPIAEARARREEARARITVVQAHVLAQLDTALANRTLALAALTEAHQLARTEAEAQRAAETGFSAGGADLLEVLTARLELNTTRLAGLDTAYHAQQAVGQLEDAVQRPFPGLNSIETSPRTLTQSP